MGGLRHGNRNPEPIKALLIVRQEPSDWPYCSGSRILLDGLLGQSSTVIFSFPLFSFCFVCFPPLLPLRGVYIRITNITGSVLRIILKGVVFFLALTLWLIDGLLVSRLNSKQSPFPSSRPIHSHSSRWCGVARCPGRNDATNQGQGRVGFTIGREEEERKKEGVVR